MEELGRRLQGLRERVARRDRLAALARRADERLGAARGRLPALTQRVDRERKDVERLEGLSIVALFHTLLSDKPERLAQERRELVEAKLARDECAHAIAGTERELARLRDEIAGLGDPDAALARVLAETEARLVSEGGAGAAELIALAEEIAAARAWESELRDAIAAGDLACDVLDELVKTLEKARHMGTYDMLGGGLIATSIKHTHLDAARELAHEAQLDLEDLRSELADVELDGELEVQVGGFGRFADYFLDGLVADWLVQSRIQRTLASVEGTMQRVDYVLAVLAPRLEAARARVDELEDRRRAILERS